MITDSCAKIIARNELFSPKLQNVDVGNEEPEFTEAKRNYIKTINNIFDIYSSFMREGQSYALSFSLTNCFHYFKDCTIKLRQEYDKRFSEYFKINDKIHDIYYESNFRNDIIKNQKASNLRQCLDKYSEKFIKPSEKGELLDIMNRVVHKLVFGDEENFIESLSQNEKNMLSTCSKDEEYHLKNLFNSQIISNNSGVDLSQILLEDETEIILNSDKIKMPYSLEFEDNNIEISESIKALETPQEVINYYERKIKEIKVLSSMKF